MRKILGLALGVTVMMMGYAEGMEAPKKSGTGIAQDPPKPGTSPDQMSKEITQGSPNSLKALALSPEGAAALEVLHKDTRLLRTMLLNANKKIIAENESALRKVIDERVKNWCAALITEVNGEKPLKWLLYQKTSRDAARLFEVGARVLDVWEIYQTTWEPDNNILLALIGILHCAVQHWEQSRARNVDAEKLVERLRKKGVITSASVNKELIAAARDILFTEEAKQKKELITAAQDILFTAAEQVDDEDE